MNGSLLFLGPDLAGASKIHLSKDALLMSSSFCYPAAFSNKGYYYSHGLLPSTPSFGIHSFIHLFSTYLSSLYARPQAID